MKKLTTLFILLFVVSTGLFAEPKVPKFTDKEDAEKCYYYVNDLLTNEYKIYSIIDNEYSYYVFYFTNISLINDKRINIIIRFRDEKSLDKFTNVIDIYNIDTEFSRIRKKLEINNVSTTSILDKNTYRIKEISLQTDFENLTK